MHHLPIHEAVLLLETDPRRGLSEDEAQQRLVRVGPNRLPRERRHGPLVRFALQFDAPLIYVLLVAGAITLALGQAVDASVIFGVVLANALIGYVQEARAEGALEALTSLVTTEVSVLRDGRRERIDSAAVVPGDLLSLEAGDKVAADLLLVEALELEVDESALTGESLPVAKSPGPLAPETEVADRLNMAFSGTLVTQGTGSGIVVATGADTEIGLIHRLIGEVGEIATPLTRKIAAFSKQLTAAILVLAAVTFAIGVARGLGLTEVFVAAVALAVGAIPEGLPAAMTITLAIGVGRMARRHAVVRRLPAVETLGSTTVICTDKTGTLTANQMTVQAIWAGGEQFEVTGVGYGPEGEVRLGAAPISLKTAPALRECLVAGSLCNQARVVRGDEDWEVVGDPTDAASLVAARKGGLEPERLVAERPRVDVIPFESARRYMATAHRAGPGEEVVVYVKGAVEAVLEMCAYVLGPDGIERPLESDTAEAATEQLAAQGLRVLALARGIASKDLSELRAEREPSRLVLVGLQAMLDPPRPEAIDAVASCRRAGIEVKMVTGDHAATAQAIAQRVGLGAAGADEAARAVRGTELAALSDDQRRSAAAKASVFARVSPEQKLRLVEALQADGEIVAMTGDGVNDAPALKRADIGVAMGRSGTEVAKESGDIVLADDNFASIEAAVEEGRRIFDNLTKFIVWTLPTNLGEGMVILVAIVAGVTLPILPVQILWINMTTAVALGLMLAFEAKEPDVMARPPRKPGRPLLTRELVGRIALVSGLLLAGTFALFEWEQGRGAPEAEARTVAVSVFVVVQLFYLFNCRSLERSMLSIGLFSNPWVSAGVTVMIALQLAFVYAPAMNSLFHSAPIGVDAWARIVAVGLFAWAIVGAEKWIRRRRGPRHAGVSAPQRCARQ